MEIRPVAKQDRESLSSLLHRIEQFNAAEVTTALELIDAAIAGSPDYLIQVALKQGKLVGYICYGPTPMTEGTWDLYWIASDPNHRGEGIGSALDSAMEAEIRARQARLIRVETSAEEAYGPTRGFYASMKYQEEARFRDFYKPGDDLIILSKRV